jgi:hypothetical protein
MKDYIKYGVYLVIALTIAYVCLTLRDCRGGGDSSATIITPADGAFSPIIKSGYTRASTPFESHSKPDVKLPSNVSESNIARVVKIYPRPLPTELGRVISMIETKDGGIYIDTAQVKTVVMIAYDEPIFRIGSFISLGVSMSTHQGLGLLPAVEFSPLQICGVIQLPLIGLDTEGLMGGLAARTKDISFGLSVHQPFIGDRQLKLSFTYNL